MFKILLIFFIYIFINFNIVETVRVCASFSDYYNIFSKNCYDNPDSDGNATKMVERWGFKSEKYSATTLDGYKLTIFRINSRTGDLKRKTPVLLAHGIYMNGLGFLHKQKKSLTFQLASNGFDVWVLNFRGSKVNIQTAEESKNKHFWDYSFDEMGKFDVPAVVDLIRKKNKKKIIFIGYSMGTSASFVYTSTYPDEAKKSLIAAISLAPIANLNNSIVKFLATFPVELFKIEIFKKLANFIFDGKILFEPVFIRRIFIAPFPAIMILREALITCIFFGFDLKQLDPMTYPVEILLVPDYISLKLFMHYAQLFKTGKFQNFDFGKIGNSIKYNQINPPIYNLDRILVPQVFYVGRNDKSASPNNSFFTYNLLNNSTKCGFHVLDDQKFNHRDFFIARDLIPLFYQDFIEDLKKIQNGLCDKK